MPPTVTPDQALQKLEHYCAYQERSPKEVRKKLAEYQLSRQDAEQIYQVLQADGFFNEERFALSFARGKFRNNHWGRVRIRQELRMREISPALIQQALEAIDEDEYLAQLQQLVQKKRASYRDDDRARDKTAAALIRAGFEMELVFRYLERE